jgi:transposase-like protein
MNQSRNPRPPASQAVKEKILIQIRDEGLSVTDASRQSGYATKTIYTWIRKGVEVTGTGTNLVLENNRLKKELEQAYSLLGRATAEMKRSKR